MRTVYDVANSPSGLRMRADDGATEQIPTLFSGNNFMGIPIWQNGNGVTRDV